MTFISEEQKRLNALYDKLKDLNEGKKILERAMHHSYFNKSIYNNLFDKLNKINVQIKSVKREIAKEKLKNEKSRKNI